ncbi:MAG: hydantoinase/oxoprolinase family protein [Halobacteria archaeon]|nr:hydantoinase/oxoprolinase family protein [Halobacteria archaeon]
MIIGVDAGGTNVDAVGLDPEDGVVTTSKASLDPSNPSKSVRDSVSKLETRGEEVERVVVATTLVLNSALQDRLPDATNVVVPGPGLSPSLAFHGDENILARGAIDHRGRVTEKAQIGEKPSNPVVAVTSKFSPRNPEVEEAVADEISEDADFIALGNESGGKLGFPERAATTVFNAKSKTVFESFEDDIGEALADAGVDAPVYYLKGDGAMLSEDAALSNPSHTVRSGSAASALGLAALSGRRDAVCVDIGGTTTDITVLDGGFPVTDEGYTVNGLSTYYDGVDSVNLPVGGDTAVVDGELGDYRGSSAVAFGGDTPTPTDALHALGEMDEGDVEAAESAVESSGATAEGIIDEAVSRIADEVGRLSRSYDKDLLVAGGVLAPYIAPRIREATQTDIGVVVPENAEVSGAVGCAAARVSVKTDIHIDTVQNVTTVTALGSTKREAGYDQLTHEEIERIACEEALRAAKDAGAGEDTGMDEVETVNMRRFNVVENSRVVGQIADATAQVVPDLSYTNRHVPSHSRGEKQ